ncbi:hypothetical protein K438DRAFT_1863917 [Mycena galopus ATCC 62051]|nr:hypothetical protein K438DRAFT_1863917 [Mycena galopus ATCC 62051]
MSSELLENNQVQESKEKETQQHESSSGDEENDLEKGLGVGAAENGGGEREKPKAAAAKTEAAAVKPQGPPGLFSWVGPALRNKRMLKTWLRCVLASAAAIILLVDKATLTTMGQAGFFAAIVSILLPPSLALSVFLMASVTLLLGAHAPRLGMGRRDHGRGLHVQDKALLATRMLAAEKGLVQGISPTLQIEVLIFKGAFLDPRVSAVYGAFFFLGTFALGTLRARMPKLAVMGIFGTLCWMCFVLWALFPTAQYTLAKMFLIPTCFYVAIAIASLVVVFPETLNHMWLTTLDGAFFGSVLSLLSLQATALGLQPSDHKAWDAVTGKIDATRTAFGGALAALNAQLGLIDLEISVGRLGATDLKRLAPELRAVGLRSSGLLAFQTAVTQANREDERADAALSAEEHEQERKEGNFNPAAHSRYARRRAMIREREARHGHDLDALVPILAAAAAPLRAEAEEAVKTLRGWFKGCNSRRWTGFFGIAGGKYSEKEIEARQAGLVKARDALGERLQEWRTKDRVKLIKPFERFFDPETGELLPHIGSARAKGLRGLEDPEMFAVRSLFICFVFCDTLDAFAARVHRVLTLVADLDLRRPNPRLWLPPGFGKLGRRLLSRDPVGLDEQPLAMGTVSDPTRFDDGDGTINGDEEDELEPPRNPDARAPTTGLGRFSVALAGVLRFFKTPEGIFALRHAVVSVALWIPAVVPRTAWFYYSNKGLWALIMAQMGLATFSGDQLFGIATRLVGTALGLLNGMVVWYIAAPGLKNGNAYAMVVVTAIFNAPYIFGRIAAPPAQSMFWTMIGVTTVFVVGYSWLDTHFQPLLASEGVGISLGWKRAVLVMIGFVAGGIVMLFPRPTSSRILVRRTLAAVLREQGSIFGKEVEAFLAEEARARSGHFEKESIDWLDQGVQDENEPKVSPKERRIRKVAHRVLVVFERLQALVPALKMGRWEPQLQSVLVFLTFEINLITTLSIIAGAFSKLDTRWCSILVQRLSDIFATIDILSNALEGGHPLPASLPCLRERLIYHDSLIRSLNRNAGPAALCLPTDSDSDDSGSDTHAEFVAGKFEGASIGFEALSLSVLMDEHLPTHSTAVVGLGRFLTLVDEIGAIVRELCGQTTFRGFDTLHHQFLGREEAAMGMFMQK